MRLKCRTGMAYIDGAGMIVCAIAKSCVNNCPKKELKGTFTANCLEDEQLMLKEH